LEILVRLDRWQAQRLRAEGVDVIDLPIGGEVGRRAG
jgi:hypothetical protein